MAIFVAFAWMIEAAEYLGLIETEAQDPKSRAYRLAHHALGLMKSELIGAPVEILSEHSVRKTAPDGSTCILECRDGEVRRSHDSQWEPLVDLGRVGGASFLAYGEGLEIKIRARTEDAGAYDLSLILPPARNAAIPPA